MGRDWNAFIKAVDRSPKEFAKAVIDHLDPPKYAKNALRTLEYLCEWSGCWTRRMDVCFKCHRGVCEEHCETFLGSKTASGRHFFFKGGIFGTKWSRHYMWIDTFGHYICALIGHSKKTYLWHDDGPHGVGEKRLICLRCNRPIVSPSN